jgi:hypothetical protein
MNTDNIDKFGHCVCCHENLLTKRVVDGKVVDMFLPTYDDTIFMLNNGSQMQVTICKKCKAHTELTDPKVQANIMEAIQKGWQLENTMLVADEKIPEWTEDKGKEYLDKMAILSIDCHSENLSKFHVEQRQMKLLNKVVEPFIEDAIIVEKEV